MMHNNTAATTASGAEWEHPLINPETRDDIRVMYQRVSETVCDLYASSHEESPAQHPTVFLRTLSRIEESSAQYPARGLFRSETSHVASPPHGKSSSQRPHALQTEAFLSKFYACSHHWHPHGAATKNSTPESSNRLLSAGTRIGIKRR